MKALNNHRRIVFFAFATMVAAALAAWTLKAPAVEAAGGQSCRCLPEQSTPAVTGESSVDCIWAKMDAIQQAESLIVGCDQGTCYQDFEVLDDNGCDKYWPEGVFRVTGQLHYSCELCIEIPDF